MSAQVLSRMRLHFTAIVILAALAHLTWEHFNGGVRIHHVLNRSDMPAISNWWGLILLPALTWFLTGRVQRRAIGGVEYGASKLPTSVVAGFAGSLIIGILLSAAFTGGHETVASCLFLSLFLLAILLPAYRAECVLGFVLGMTFVFGAVLPTAISCIVAAVSAVIHLVLRPAVVRLWSRVTLPSA